MRSFSSTFRSRVLELFIAGLLASAASGCPARGTNEARRYFVPQPVPAPQRDADGRIVVDFAALKSSVLDARCIECHSDMETPEGLAPYVKAGDPGGSPLFTTMADGSMPPGGPRVEDDLIELVREYVLQLE